MPEFFCSHCRTVTLSGSDSCHHCGRQMVGFNPSKHGRFLVSSANTWNQVYSKWHDHPIFEEVSERLHESGCYGAGSHMNAFIEELLKRPNLREE